MSSPQMLGLEISHAEVFELIKKHIPEVDPKIANLFLVWMTEFQQELTMNTMRFILTNGKGNSTARMIAATAVIAAVKAQDLISNFNHDGERELAVANELAQLVLKKTIKLKAKDGTLPGSEKESSSS